MKKYYKNFKTKRMTVDAMASCYERCFTRCRCSAGCGSSVINGQAATATPNFGSAIDDKMAAYAAAG